MASCDEALATLRNVSHQLWGCFQIPIGVTDMAVSQIGRQRDHMPCDAIAIIRARFQCSDCKGVTKRVDGRPWPARFALQADLPSGGAECNFGAANQKRLSA